MASIRQSVRRMCEAREAAVNAFAGVIASFVEGDTETAAKAARYFVSKKLARFDGIRYVVKHGALLEADVIRKAAVA